MTARSKENKKKVSVKKQKWFGIFEKNKKMNSKLFKVIGFFMGIFLIISTYAWFSSSLDVKIRFFNIMVSSDSGLFISLDGVNYSDSIDISLDTVINDLKATYPNHTNQWSVSGLWPVSSNGIGNVTRDKFDVFVGQFSKLKKGETVRFLNTKLTPETESNANNVFIAFDIFLKNISGSPKSDNLYFDEDTLIRFEDDTPEDVMESMTNIMNSMRMGLVKIASVPSTTPAQIVQNLKCNPTCSSLIYELNSTLHSTDSIDKAEKYGLNLIDGVYYPTYGIIKEGNNLNHSSGHMGTGIPLDTEHFSLQNTITNFERPIFQIPNGVTKLRAYVWIEGQDIDSLETNSKGAPIFIAINFVKDLAGYE